MAASKKWYKGCFIMVTTHENSGERFGGEEYRHPTLRICRLDGEHREPDNLALSISTTPSTTELAFTFQTHVRKPGEMPRTPGHEYLDVQEGKTFVPCYGGKLDTEIRVEQYGVQMGNIVKRVKDVDRALKTYREKISKLGVSRSECDLTVLMLALSSTWNLPVQFICWTGHGDPLVVVARAGESIPLGAPTWGRLKHRNADWGKAALPPHCIGRGPECTEPDGSCTQCPVVREKPPGGSIEGTHLPADYHEGPFP